MAEVIDQENISGTIGIGFGDTGNGRDYMCQGFIPTLDNITAVSFQLNSTGSKGMKVWIDNADASYFPTGAVGVGIGGATEIPNGSLTTSLTKYTLASSVTLVPGNRYVICSAPWNTSTHVWEADYRDVKSSVSNPYANGRRVHADAAYTSFGAPDSGNADILFRTYGESTTTLTKTITAKARIKQVLVKTVQAKARVRQVGVKTITARAKIVNFNIKTIGAKAKIVKRSGYWRLQQQQYPLPMADDGGSQ